MPEYESIYSISGGKKGGYTQKIYFPRWYGEGRMDSRKRKVEVNLNSFCTLETICARVSRDKKERPLKTVNVS